MPTTYQYFIEDSDLAVTELSQEDAEAMRADDWHSASDLPDGVEYAGAIDKAGKKARLHRVANCPAGAKKISG